MEGREACEGLCVANLPLPARFVRQSGVRVSLAVQDWLMMVPRRLPSAVVRGLLSMKRDLVRAGVTFPLGRCIPGREVRAERYFVRSRLRACRMKAGSRSDASRDLCVLPRDSRPCPDADTCRGGDMEQPWRVHGKKGSGDGNRSEQDTLA